MWYTYVTICDEQFFAVERKGKPETIDYNGARQVGKTWLMKEFGQQSYEKVAYISFYNNKRMGAVFENDFDINRIIMNLGIESLKYFCEEAPEYHVVAAGSLWGWQFMKGYLILLEK